MEQRITHACGHEQVHYLQGFASQQNRKARWLQTTRCRTCFIADKQAEQTAATAREGTAVAHLDLPALTGSDRQVAWATTIRAQRLAAIIVASAADNANNLRAGCLITDAKWWIDHRDLADLDLLEQAAQQTDAKQETQFDSAEARGREMMATAMRATEAATIARPAA